MDENVKDIDIVEENMSEEFNNEDLFNNTNKRTQIIKVIVISLIICILFSSFYLYMYHKRVTMQKSHIYVCDDAENYSDFDLWIKEHINEVPSFIIIKDKKIVGTILGETNEKDFTSQLGTILINPITEGNDLVDYKITNLENESKSLNEICNTNDLYIIEISWIDCPDCVRQDKNNTISIYRKYSTKNIYRYYIKTEKEKLFEKYE